MKIPKKLKIGGHIYRVKFRDRHVEDGVDTAGNCLCTQTTIWIDKTAKQSQQESTFFHEIIEAINGESELKLEHTQICALEFGLYQVLKDNHLLKE